MIVRMSRSFYESYLERCNQHRFAKAGDTIALFTGLLRDGRMETLWHVIAGSAVKSPQSGQPPELMKLPWAHAAQTNADTFRRVDS